MVCYGEVKTNSSDCDKQLGVKGHASLAKDHALSNPEILRFVSTLLYETGRHEEASFVSDIGLGRAQCDRRHDLFLVHETGNWSEEILDNLENCNLDERLVDFSVKVLLIRDLRTVIEETYDRTWEAAREMADG